MLNIVLLSPDGQTPRDHFFHRLGDGNIGTLLLKLIALARHKPRNCGREQEKSVVFLRRRGTNLARNSGVINKSPRTFTAKNPPPVDEHTFAHQQAKHPVDDRNGIAAAAAAATDSPASPADGAPTDSPWQLEEEFSPDSA